MANNALPNFIVLSVPESATKTYVCRKDDGSIVAGEDSVFSPLVKIEVERATYDNNYVHLRFSHNNKYWKINKADDSIIAVSNKPEEDSSKWSCTLFMPILESGVLYLTHSSGWPVMMNNSTNAFYIDSYSKGGVPLGFVNWDTLVKLPPHIALKGDNGSYLKAYHNDGNHLQFGSDDGNDVLSGHKVTLMPDGHVRILSDHFGMFWGMEDPDDNWIYAADLDEGNGNEITGLFWPVKIDENTIALRSAANNNFCQRFTNSQVTNCLAASVGTITREARLLVEELVYQRKIYNVRFRMEDSRIYGEVPFLAGTAKVTNNTDKEDSMTVSITYQDEKSYTFSRSVSVTGGVKTIIQAGVPLIAEGKTEESLCISRSLQWDTATKINTSVTASGTVPVPAKSMAVVDYVGKRGTCNIPFCYTQEDHRRSGAIDHSEQIDGIYEGVSYYNFDFHVRSVHPI